ncbi:response regulator [Treponema ruminis]|uniref:histidine kinase n=1 Tax=Treponema ruminis TaxID=744515 RepID=A0A7W8LN76_9SPIR|nr:response regulator [Treponema ruminis]MBB5227222.1 CheY-like chemotaxis protein [Treponema ruminis]QSI01549.1 response regulator [Treponema ruminis]
MQENNKAGQSSDIDNTTRFFANALHEIRTPIQTIIGAAELMRNTALDKEQNEYVRQILFSAEGLLDLANNILDLAKMNQVGFKIENIPFDISYVAEHLIDSESVKAFNRGVELVLDISPNVPALVTGDSMRVRQIMLNLISNAVKFTKEGYVHVELDYNDSDGICFTVTDSGIGISEEKQKKIFTEYFQADLSTYRLFGGTGLGLSISRNLVNLMNGKIGVKSNPTGGSVFWFKIPLSVALAKPAKIRFSQSTENFRILIVDDNEIAAESLLKKLLYLGFKKTKVCTDASKALDILSEAEKEGDPFSIAFIDMIMKGGLDGWHLAFDLQQIGNLSTSLYLLVPEGQMHEDAKMKFLNLYKGYLYKPIKKDGLISLLSEELYESENSGKSGNKLESKPIEELVPITPEEEKSLSAGKSASSKAENKKIAEGLKILVAEDHPMNRKLLATFLERFGAEVYLAENGEDALDIIRNTPEISMIFMDIYMPEMNGIEATKELRAMHYNEIIIACTANNDSNDFAEYKRSGINDILVKPFKSDTLKAMIEKWKAVMQTVSFAQINLLNIGNDLFIEYAEEA